MQHPHTVLETPRLILRTWTLDDIEAMLCINQDPRVMEYFPSLQDRKATENQINKWDAQYKNKGYTLYAIDLKDSGTFIGFTGLLDVDDNLPFAPAVEIGWRIAFDHWGKGYATEAANACIIHAFTQLQLDELVSMTAVENKKSRRVMEKIGMTRNPLDDFDHPKLQSTSHLCRHVLYRIQNPA